MSEPDSTDTEPSGFDVIDVQAASDLLAAGTALLIDVREPQEYEFEHVPGALLQPLSFLDPDLFPNISEKKMLFICGVGKRSAAACKQLAKAGFTNLTNISGGMDAWREAELDLEGTRFETHDYMI
jgi:rhodanese-related sulfurtransferase